jgi:RsiW-degrading membrane proteinase PrsW (M82 family)
MVALSLLVAVLPIAACYLLRWWLGRDRLQPIWIFPMLVLAGGLGGLLFGWVLSHELEAWFSPFALDRQILGRAVVGPLAEEVGKGLVLLVFLATRWYRSPVDGLLYGLSAGTGYAVVENLLTFLLAYSEGGGSHWLDSVLVRLPAGLVIHGGATALVGAYLGAARWERRPLIVFASLPAALFMATAVHGGWNALVHLAGAPRGEAHAAGAMGLLAAVGIGFALLLYASLRQEAADVREELAAEVAEGRLSERVAALVADPRGRRAPGQRALATAAIALAFARRRARIEERGAEDVERWRAAVRAEIAAVKPERGVTPVA